MCDLPLSAEYSPDLVGVLIYNFPPFRPHTCLTVLTLSIPKAPFTLEATFYEKCGHNGFTNRAIASICLAVMQHGDMNPTIWIKIYADQGAEVAHLKSIIKGVR